MALEGRVTSGRGDTFEPWMCEKIKDIAGTPGGCVAKMCLAIGVRSRDTFYRWLNLYPEFKEAYEEARLIRLSKLEELLDGMATGQVKGDFKAVAMSLNNQFREDYSRSGTGGTEITINQIGSMSSDELNSRIDLLNKKLALVDKADE